MARRRRKNNDSPVAELVGLITIGLGFGAFTTIKDFSDENPWIVPLSIALVAALFAGLIYWRISDFIKSRKADKAFAIADIDSMDGVAFEYYLAKVFRSRGYSDVRVTEKYDLGVDLVAKKDGITWGIQAKRYKSKVKADAVRQVYTGLNRYKCDRAMVVTNSFFTRPAIELAKDNNCALVDRNTLKEWVSEYSTC